MSVIRAKELEWINFGRKMKDESRNNQNLFYKIMKNPRKGRENDIKQMRDKNGIINQR